MQNIAISNGIVQVY